MEVKRFLGFVLLGMCVYLLQPFFSYPIILKFYTVFLLLVAVYYFSTSKKSWIKFMFGLFLVGIAFYLLTVSMAVNQEDLIVLNKFKVLSA